MQTTNKSVKKVIPQTVVSVESARSLPKETRVKDFSYHVRQGLKNEYNQKLGITPELVLDTTSSEDSFD